MSKVLISFLGTGHKDANRNYSSAEYRFDDKASEKTSFFALALKKHYGIDKMILIGTPKSMWEEVYLTMAGDKADEDIYGKIAEYCSSANIDTSIDSIPCQGEIEKAMGNGSKIMLVHYGLTPEELEENSRKVLGVEQYLNSDDKVYVDITHSFRSLPLMLMNTLIYLKNNSLLNISIQTVSYGMLDVMGEMKQVKGESYAPVVRLDSVLRMNEWISAANEFKNSLNANGIAKLMKMGFVNDKNEMVVNKADKKVADMLIELSDAISLNHLKSVKESLRTLSGVDFSDLSDYAKMTVVPVINSLVKEKIGVCSSDAKTIYKLGQLHYSQRRYASAAICVAECFLFIAKKVAGMPVTKDNTDNDKDGKQLIQDAMFYGAKNQRRYDVDYKEKVKKWNGKLLDGLRKQTISLDDYCDSYSKVNNVRKAVAHVTHTEGTMNDMIEAIREALKYINGHFIENGKIV